jgi:hypothetical protein
MSESKGPWIEIWETCKACGGTGRNSKATHPMDSACMVCRQIDGPKMGKVSRMITFPGFHDIMHGRKDK